MVIQSNITLVRYQSKVSLDSLVTIAVLNSLILAIHELVHGDVVNITTSKLGSGALEWSLFLTIYEVTTITINGEDSVFTI